MHVVARSLSSGRTLSLVTLAPPGTRGVTEAKAEKETRGTRGLGNRLRTLRGFEFLRPSTADWQTTINRRRCRFVQRGKQISSHLPERWQSVRIWRWMRYLIVKDSPLDATDPMIGDTTGYPASCVEVLLTNGRALHRALRMYRKTIPTTNVLWITLYTSLTLFLDLEPPFQSIEFLFFPSSYGHSGPLWICSVARQVALPLPAEVRATATTLSRCQTTAQWGTGQVL